MTQQLRDELARIATSSDRFTLPDDLWTRGRRARTRGRLLAAGAALAVIVSVGSLAVSVAGGPLPPLPTGSPDDAAVPMSLEAVPEWLVQLPESDTSEATWAPELEVTSDLAIGRAAAAFAVGEYGRLPVVVAATDGRYLPLDLPGFSDAGSINQPVGEGSALALSPDGTRLAYAWWDPTASLEAPMPAGVRVVDLSTGDITTISLQGGNGIDVDLLAWSPASEWLAWYGQETRTWTPMSKGGSGDSLAGRIRVGSTTSEPVTLMGPEASRTIAISDEGQVAYWDGRRVTTDDRRIRVSGARPGWWAPGKFAPGSDVIALSDGSLGSLPLVDVVTGREEYAPTPSEGPAGAEVRPHGWTSGGQVVATRGTADGRQDATLALVDPTGDHWQSVGAVAPELLGSLTLATDLMTTDRPTVERSAPEWPWSPERRAVVAGLGVITLLGLVVVAGRRWRAARPVAQPRR